MGKLVTISREYGSGGRIIGELLAKKLNVPFYDKAVIDLAVEASGFSKEAIEGAELKAKSSFAYSWASAAPFGSDALGAAGMSMNDKIFLAQFQVIKEIGEKGEGVIVGRCADYVLKDIPGVVNVFVYDRMPGRIKRATEKYGDDPKKIEQIIENYDKARRNYYSYHTGQVWGEYTNYDICINTADIVEDDAASIIAEFIKHTR